MNRNRVQKASDIEAALFAVSRAALYKTPGDDANKKTVLEMHEQMKDGRECRSGR